MKKLLLVIPVILISAACNGENTKIVDVFGVECEWVADGEMSSLVRCPVVSELEVIQSETPNVMFIEGDFGEKNFSEYVREDKEHIYVNIVKDECGKDTTGYRIIVKEPVIDGVSMYAVDKCI